MSIKEILVDVSSIFAVLLYCPIIYLILHGKIEQSLATWSLWVLLDAIALVTIILQKGNYLLLVCYVIGGSLVTLCLIYKRLCKWTWFETLVLMLVVICLVIWKLSGPKWATIASTIAVCISACPQIRDSWKGPDKMTGLIYLGYAIVNSLSFFGGKTWTIAERFYPGMMVPFCFAVAFAALRKVSANDSQTLKAPL